MTATIERIEDLATVLDPQDTNVLLVTGTRSYFDTGADQLLAKVLQGRNTIHFCEFEINPKLSDVETGVELYRKHECSLVLAVGGGSALDVGKAIHILSDQTGDKRSIVANNSAKSDLSGRFIAIPTTAGSGAEATHFAVVYIDKTKYSLTHPNAAPGIAVLDSRMTEQLPPSVAAATGADAIAQATESFWSINSTSVSRDFSRRSLELTLPNIESAVLTRDLSSRNAMLRGAHLAGKAINIAKTTAAHAVSYPMTSHFGIPHGQAVGVTLPSFFVFNADPKNSIINDPRGESFVRDRMSELLSIYGVATADQAKAKLDRLLISIGLECTLTPLGIDDQAIDLIVKNGFNPQRVKNNPRCVERSQLRRMLRSLRTPQ